MPDWRAIRRNGWRRSGGDRRWRPTLSWPQEEERRIEAEKGQQRNAEGRKKPGKPAAPLPDEPDPKAQSNFTDPDSRIMKSKEGFVQAYNARQPSTQRPRSLSRTNSRRSAAIRANWCPWSKPSRKSRSQVIEASADFGLSPRHLEGLEHVASTSMARTCSHPTVANGMGGPLCTQ